MSYRYAVLDPRSGADNESIFENSVFGIEVTVPALAVRCTGGNIDPQHTGGNANLAAIEAALTVQLPVEGATLATVRVDLDAVGSMAVLSFRRKEIDFAPAMERIGQVAEADKFSQGGWPGVRPLAEFGKEVDPLASIAAAIGDFKVPIDQRVTWMEQWLLSGKEPENYQTQVQREKADIIRALGEGSISVKLMDGIAVVESTHRAALSIGYRLSPVVIALNPEFRFQGGEPSRKFTVCQFKTGYVNLGKIASELANLEKGWGGSPTIIGSPQGSSSVLTVEQVAGIVRRNIIPADCRGCGSQEDLGINNLGNWVYVDNGVVCTTLTFGQKCPKKWWDQEAVPASASLLEHYKKEEESSGTSAVGFLCLAAEKQRSARNI